MLFIKTMTCDAWLSTTSPEVAVICVGPNSYGHPTSAVLSRLEAHNVEVYRTDYDGTIVVTTDGVSWDVR